jgi:hypothetical protein
VSSLWTPEGEHRVEKPSSSTPPAQTPPSGGGSGSRPPAEADEEEFLGPDEEELEEVRRQLLEAPVEVVIANHAYGLFELAALHLSASPPNLEEARLAVDALGALVEGLAGRLGEVAAPLTQALAQIRLAYVQISAAPVSDGDQPG